jgi:sugar lactone lactonase YvrE
MVPATKHSGALVLRLMVGLALLGWPRVGAAEGRDVQGTWSVISLPPPPGPPKPGQVVSPTALAADAAGNLYVADSGTGIQKRDAQGNWSVIATQGTALGHVLGVPALAVDGAGNLYVADFASSSRIQKRDAEGNWSVIATAGPALGQVNGSDALAVDGTGNLYVDEYFNQRIQKRDAQGNWSAIATGGTALGQVFGVFALAADAAGNLYVAEGEGGPLQKRNKILPQNRIQKRDVQGNWSLIANYHGQGGGQVNNPSALATDIAGNLYAVDIWYNISLRGQIQKRDVQGNWSNIELFRGFHRPEVLALAVDGAGNLYVAETWGSYNVSDDGPLYQIRKRDAQENWSVIATAGASPWEVSNPSGLAVDATGSLYVADSGNHRVLKYTPNP